jgi:hypothetical protein
MKKWKFDLEECCVHTGLTTDRMNDIKNFMIKILVAFEGKGEM